jgi:hypothetical protein
MSPHGLPFRIRLEVMNPYHHPWQWWTRNRHPQPRNEQATPSRWFFVRYVIRLDFEEPMEHTPLNIITGQWFCRRSLTNTKYSGEFPGCDSPVVSNMTSSSLHCCRRHSCWWAARAREIRHIALSLFWRCQSLCPTPDSAFSHCHVSTDVYKSPVNICDWYVFCQKNLNYVSLFRMHVAHRPHFETSLLLTTI